jgi:quercetin dioxygenase-like cupin family protein
MQLRRVVTGFNSAGESIVESDGQPAIYTAPVVPRGVDVSVLWVTHATPPRCDEGEDPSVAAWRVGPLPDSGTRWSMIEIRPGAEARGMHRTDTIDYVQVQSGEIWLVMGGGDSVHLSAGDMVVQRGTEHRWENRSDQPCVMTSVMLSTIRSLDPD